MKKLKIAPPPPIFTFIISLIIALFYFQSCQNTTAPLINNENAEALEKAGEINLIELDMIAKSLAKTLKKNALRKILRSETQKADTREHILDAKTFLEKNFSYNGKFYNFKKEMLTIAASNERDILNKALKKLNKGKVDIYFPVDKHFEKWDPNDQKIKVGYVNPFKEFDPVNVYDIDGNHYLLSSKAPPEEAVLMVNYCEHHGNHEITPQRREDDPGDGDGGGGGSGGGGSGGTNDRRIYFEWISFNDWSDYEPWTSGDPEFKMFFAITNKSTYKLTYTFGDEYGYWTWYGAYKRYIATDGWNHKSQYFVTIKSSNTDNEEYSYGSVKLIEEDKDIGEVSFNLEIPLTAFIDGAKATWTVKFSELDDDVGENTFIKLWKSPYFRGYNERNTAPLYKTECSVAGGSYLVFWWDHS